MGRIGIAVVEFGYAAPADLADELLERARTLRNLALQHRFALLAELRLLRHETDPVEVHVGSGNDADARVALLRGLFRGRESERAEREAAQKAERAERAERKSRAAKPAGQRRSAKKGAVAADVKAAARAAKEAAETKAKADLAAKRQAKVVEAAAAVAAAVEAPQAEAPAEA